eukprot:5597494-Prymnesium_polylepis.1
MQGSSRGIAYSAERGDDDGEGGPAEEGVGGVVDERPWDVDGHRPEGELQVAVPHCEHRRLEHLPNGARGAG